MGEQGNSHPLARCAGKSSTVDTVSVVCGSSRLQVMVPADLFGNGVPMSARELTLGAGCAVTAVRPDSLTGIYLLSACGATIEVRAETSIWSSLLSDPTYYLSDLINIQASVKIYVDECVARPSMESSMKYEVITDHGYLVDGQHSRSRFLTLRGDQFLRFQRDTFVFTNASNNPIYLLCHLKAVAAGPANQRNKACSYDPVAAVWRSQEGGDCSCCASPAGCGSRRRRRHQPHYREGRGCSLPAGLLGEADLQLGPIRLACNLSTTLVSSPLALASAELTSAMAGAVELSSTGPFSGTPKAGRPVLFPPNRAANPIIRGEAKDSSGLWLPFSITNLAIAVLCSLFIFLGILDCYCSTKCYHRGYRMGATDTATGETSAVAMAPTASGDTNVASTKPGAVVAAACVDLALYEPPVSS
ncbi:zona pellucida sperm-binding protein 3-like [Emydura macquarii macquarii]|uniref:zona pellucida sperm-binding protein 3-like n=1 Tax=Emydura macquarii macquarii TaxID=1129001 RepID=UPI00352B24B7